MNPQKAEEILHAYGVIIEKISKAGFVMAAPKTLLPYPKKDIKEAVIMAIKKVSKDDRKMYESLKTVYLMLANFIPDEEAKIYNAVLELIRSNNSQNISPDLLKKHSAIEDKISQETDMLHQELANI